MNKIFISIFISFLFVGKAYSDPLNIVTTIKPIHDLVSAVIKDKHNIKMLLEKADSPHGYSVRPSDIRNIEEADIVFLINIDFENFLRKIKQEKRFSTKFIELSSMKGIELLDVRENNIWEADNLKHHHDHHHDKFDFHIWLDINNAKAMLLAIANEISSYDPENSEFYMNNALKNIEDLENLDQEIIMKLKSVQNKPYLVFHDAYQYFEKQYGLNSKGAISINPELQPSAKSISDLSALLKKNDIKCVFKEPQFDSKIINTIASNAKIKIGELDPIWGNQDNNESNGYINLLRSITKNISFCLSDNNSHN